MFFLLLASLAGLQFCARGALEVHNDAEPLEGRSPGGRQRDRQPLQVVQVAIAQTSVKSRTEPGRRRLRARTFRHFEFRQDFLRRICMCIIMRTCTHAYTCMRTMW